MGSSSVAGVVTAGTALALLLTSLTGLLVAVTKFLPVLRGGARKLDRVADTVDGVHVIVNQQKTDMERYQRALIAALREAGIDVPADQSKAD